MRKYIPAGLFLFLAIEVVVCFYFGITSPDRHTLNPVTKEGCYMATKGSDDVAGYYCDFVGDGVRQTLKYDQKNWETLRSGVDETYIVEVKKGGLVWSISNVVATLFALLCLIMAYWFFPKNKNN